MKAQEMLLAIVGIYNKFFEGCGPSITKGRKFEFKVIGYTSKPKARPINEAMTCIVTATCDNFSQSIENQSKERMLRDMMKTEARRWRLGGKFEEGSGFSITLYELTANFPIPSTEVPPNFFSFPPQMGELIKVRDKFEAQIFHLDEAGPKLQSGGFIKIPAVITRRKAKLKRALASIGTTYNARDKKIQGLVSDFHRRAAALFGLSPQNKELLRLLPRTGEGASVIVDIACGDSQKLHETKFKLR